MKILHYTFPAMDYTLNKPEQHKLLFAQHLVTEGKGVRKENYQESPKSLVIINKNKM